MASPKMFAEVTIAGSYKNLAKSTRGASKELSIFEKNAKNISKAVSAAFAGIALAGINMLSDALLDMAKSAATDRKSVALLSKTMDNSWKATDKTKQGVEDYLQKTSNLTGILDDDLRPAFGKIVRVTKQSGSAQKAFSRVLDIAAGTGKDVNVVAQAYSKYLGGNKTALERLVPGLKDANSVMGFLDAKYKGMAKTAGDNDPFAKINAVLDNFKEKLGAAFLPLIDKLAAWLGTDSAQKAMDDFAQSVQDLFSWFASPEGQKGMDDFLQKVVSIADAVNKFIAGWEKAAPFIDAWLKFTGAVNMAMVAPAAYALQATGILPGNQPPPVVINYTDNSKITAMTGAEAVRALKEGASKKGQTILKMLTAP